MFSLRKWFAPGFMPDGAEVGPAVTTPVVPKTLSEALRAGAKLRPQCSGYLFLDGKSCALGAIYEAVYGYPGDGAFSGITDDPRTGTSLADRLEEHFSALRGNGLLWSEIWSKNDHWKLPREQIADWLESLGL